MPGFKSGFPSTFAGMAKAFEIPPSLKVLLEKASKRVGTPQQRFQASVASWKQDGPEVFESVKQLEKSLQEMNVANDIAKKDFPNIDPSLYSKPIEVDWDWYRARFRTPGIVDKFKKLWDNFPEPAPFVEGAELWASWCKEVELQILEVEEIAKTSDLRIIELEAEVKKVDAEIAGLRERKLEDEIAAYPEYNAKIEEDIENNIWNYVDTEENYNDPLRFPDHPATKAALAREAAHGHH